ncbi:MAG: ABC transporter permease, partial [Terriglobales bacterium]
MLQGLRLAARRLRAERGFTLVGVLTLSLGLGANLAVFALIEGVLLRPLPYQAPRQLYSIREVIPSASRQFPSLPVNERSLLAWREQARSFSGFALVHPAAMDLTGIGAARQVVVDRVSANLFSLLGVRLAFGHGFAAGDDAAGRNHEVVLSDGFWHAQFGADAHVLGRRLELNGQVCEIVGVLPPGFEFPRGGDWGSFVAAAAAAGPPQMFQPLPLDPARQGIIGNFDFAAIGRLRAGANP